MPPIKTVSVFHPEKKLRYNINEVDLPSYREQGFVLSSEADKDPEAAKAAEKPAGKYDPLKDIVKK